MLTKMALCFEPTRAAGLSRMEDFLENSAADYRQSRNFVLGGGLHNNVSRLSPYLRYRMITEREFVGRALEHLGPERGRCLIDEILWRTYWKGYLRHYPSLYSEYVEKRDSLLRCKPKGYDQAIRGETGIACFDDWALELRETGYLHNHARMWWASIWVFTLELPWQLGAAFFERYLVDADPASNTLSWRWVAGLHTPGKIYQASASNIATYTNNRYPNTPNLASSPTIPDYRRGKAEANPLNAWIVGSQAERQENARAGLLVMAHDLHPESQWPRVFGPIALWVRASPQVGAAAKFRAGAILDAQRRLEGWSGASIQSFTSLDAVLDWAKQSQLGVLRMSAPPIAQAMPQIPQLGAQLASKGVVLELCERPWERLSWPHAAKGFFPFRKKGGPELLALAR